jgi:hypothetical protein
VIKQQRSNAAPKRTELCVRAAGGNDFLCSYKE